MLLKAISALASIVATAFPWSLQSGSTEVLSKSPKLGMVHRIRNFASRNASCPNSPPLVGNITNGGGEILEGDVKFYYIFYGNWTSNQKSILTDFAENIGGSNYSNIETTYGASGQMTFAGSIDDNYSIGKDLGGNLPTIVQNTLDKGLLPANNNSVYFVLSSPDVTEGEFCDVYCGYHYFATMANTTIVYSYIGNPQTQCMEGCGPCNLKVSPNGDVGVDAMISVIAHELMESISDPHVDAWRDADGNENADKCAWNFGNSVKKDRNHAFYNIVLGKRKYLIQQNWDAKTQSCAMSAKKEK